ncbi:hypothetical protein NQ315_002945 [Exocentrus adspersus]|uniref:Uncharacterized protein n=1 Tax=Exocentrus adspersus TaxID=1586481 RepID=A0AAV8W3V0_9CUCU|nr:hypothetical protein NQ315_002945 [Exocentrus adspersus]
MDKVGVCLFLIVVLIEISHQTLEEDIREKINNSNGTEKSLSRKRRYLVFPTGSSLQLVYCLTVPSVGMGQIFTLGHTAALAWELPDKPEFILDLKNKKNPTTTEAPETTLPHLHLDHDYEDFHQYDTPIERFDKPSKYFSGGWSSQYNKQRPGAVNNRKTYYDPFFINQPHSSVLGYSPVKAMSNQGAYGWAKTNSITGANKKAGYRGSSRPSPITYPLASIDRRKNEKKPVTTYIHPVYHQHYRRTRRDLYGKIENLFTALSKDGKACLLKAICEVSQVAHRKGTFMEEIIKAVFRIKPHDDYPDEDDYDKAANRRHNCTEQYPTCDGSIWSSMLSY